MILSDTSVWVAHLRSGNAVLAAHLERGEVLGHPWVVGELALGHLRQRDEVLGLLASLPRATVATAEELLALIDRQRLHGLGIGYVDAQLLACTRLTDGATLWTGDRRLQTAATRLGIAFEPS